MAEYIEYHPLKFWLDPASIAEIVAHIQSYLVANPINSTTEIETIIHDYIIAHPELVGGVDSVNGETGEVILTADNISAGETVTIKDVLNSLSNQIDDIVNDIYNLKSIIGTKEVFPVCNAISASIGISGKINSNSDCRTLYFTAEPNKIYIIQKPAGHRFVVGESDVQPAVDVIMRNLVTDNTATQIVYKTSDIAQYVGVFCFYAQTDTDITPIKMCQNVRVFIPTTQPDYFFREQYALTPYMIYDGTKNLSYNIFRKTINASLQSIGYHDKKIYVIYVGGIRIYAQNGIPQTLTFADLAHPQYCEDVGDALMITTTTADDGRGVYLLNYETLEFTKIITFSEGVNAVCTSKVDDTMYKVIAWSGNTNDLIFYDYNITTSELTEIGRYTLSRRYYQGGCRINNVYYMMTNSGATDSFVEIVDGDTFTKIGQITIKGLGECEGFFIYVDGESIYAYSVSNTYNRVIKIKLE